MIDEEGCSSDGKREEKGEVGEEVEEEEKNPTEKEKEGQESEELAEKTGEKSPEKEKRKKIIPSRLLDEISPAKSRSSVRITIMFSSALQ